MKNKKLTSKEISKQKCAQGAFLTKGRARTFDDKKTYKRNKNKKETKDIIDESKES